MLEFELFKLKYFYLSVATFWMKVEQADSFTNGDS